MTQLIDFRMADGSRHFAVLPEVYPWETVRDHLATLRGATITDFVTDHVTEVWIDFVFHGYKMAINNPLGEFWLFVDDPGCSDSILLEVVSHCEKIALPRKRSPN